MNRDDWDVDEPKGDFADRVMARIEEEPRAEIATAPARRTRVAAGVGGVLALAAGLALAIGWHAGNAKDHGEAIVAERTQLALGARTVAVLERGAHVKWNGDEVEQTAGDVFYRVEPGGAFRVHTPAGDVAVLGTCFRVQLESEEPVNGRDVKAGVIGAAVAAAAMVSVYEGKVAVSHGKDAVMLTAGESARADGTGVHHAGGQPVNETTSNDPLVAANENLADQVRDYKRQLESIEAQKGTTERQLAEAQKKLALADHDAQSGPPKNPNDLTQDDWKELAAKGEVRSRIPCLPSEENALTTPKNLAADGLPESDLQPINAALQQSSQKIWDTIRPLCLKALDGNGAVADALGQNACESLVFAMAKKHEDTAEEIREVAEIRAGERPVPKDMTSLGTVGQLVYTMSGESTSLEQQLAQSIGPDDAHAFVYSDHGCWSSSSWGVGPRPSLPGQTPTP
jgi:ferric-dicitrate binding protein FerR (iron transport regulator)